jgi:hypothetical protein
MPFFECKVSRTVFTDDLQSKRLTDIVYVEAKDERDAKDKAGHPRYWLRCAGTFGKGDKLSLLITVGECRPVDDHKARALRTVEPACEPAQLHESPYWGEHDDSRRT